MTIHRVDYDDVRQGVIHLDQFKRARGAGLHLLESPLSEDQNVVEEKGRYRISATVVESAILDKWLFGFDEQVREIKRQAARG